MKKVDRKAVHQFLNDLVAGQSTEEQVAMLKDIIVDEFCFQGIEDDKNLTDLEREVHAEMSQPDAGAKKIATIKKVREYTGMGLAEAKAFVESLTPGHPTYGVKPTNLGPLQKSMVTEHFLDQIGHKINKIAKDYGKQPPF